MSTCALLAKIFTQSFVTEVSWVSQLCLFINACWLSDKSWYSSKLSHAILAYYMFKQLTWQACQGHGAIVTSKSPIPFLKEGTDVSSVSRDCWSKCANTGPSSLASSFRTLAWNSSGSDAFEGFKPLSNLTTPSEDPTILSMKGPIFWLTESHCTQFCWTYHWIDQLVPLPFQSLIALLPIFFH